MIKTLDIEPTTICNLNCPFCFGPKVEKRETEIDLQIWKDALLKFRNKGVENIVISGGEPLIYHRIVELVKYLKHLNFNIVISTHGRYKEKLFEVAPYCDWISLPIDGITPEISHTMRTDNYPVSEILVTASELKRKHSNLKIKIGTVATQKNIQEIIEIGNVLQDNSNCFDTWKIYQYTPRRKHKNQKEFLSITDKEFADLSNLISKTLPTEMKIVYSSNESRRNAYTFIYQNGDINLVNVGDNFDDLLVGNIGEFDKINFPKVNEILNTNHYSNFTNTY
ncbi:MAG: radical SAM protein [Dysgonamonadaceae bacterium]|nr:radical SAM protein [Dysgonamonadaceae bacterium]